MIKNKRGDLTISMIVWIAIGVIVLVFMIFGFTTGWNNLWDKITIIGGADVNTDIIRQACSMSCMTGAGYGFCNQERDLTFEKGKTITGSCNDFATLNPSLGIEKCSTSCSNAADGCKVGGKEDKNCDGVVEEVVVDEGIKAFASLGETEVKTFSDNECKEGLNQRKEDKEIPDRLCYWAAMSKVYGERCKNLAEADILEIFERKESYRTLNNPNWPTLSTEGDFCVSVTYDCEQWDKSGKDKYKYGGFFAPENPFGITPGIHINPYKNYSQEYILNTILLHEGLHSIQTKNDEDTHLGEGREYSGGMLGQFDIGGNMENQAKVMGIKEQIKFHLKFIEEGQEAVLTVLKEQREQIFNSDISSEEKTRAVQDNVAESKRVLRVYVAARYARYQTYEPSMLEEYYLNNVKEPLLSNGGFSKEVEKAYNSILKLNEEAYFLSKEYWVKGYVGERIEIDPRLSEVQRWWLEKTAPNCEIIYDTEKAKEVLDAFLAEENLPEVYKSSQQDLELLLYIYGGTEYEDEVYNKLVNRLPGLASTQELNTDEMYA